MDSLPKKPNDGKPELVLKHVSLFKASTLSYGIMSAIGLAIIYWGHKNFIGALMLPADGLAVGRYFLIGALGAGCLIVLSYFFDDWFPSYRELKSVMMRLFGPSTVGMAIYLAAVSSLGEELFFRGAIQPIFGLWPTSIVFGLLHVGPGGKPSAWTAWTILAGLMLGWMYEETGSLWPGFVTHFCVNASSILSLRRGYRASVEHLTTGSDNETDDDKTSGES